MRDDLREKWQYLFAAGRLAEYMNLPDGKEVVMIMDNYRERHKVSHLVCSDLDAMHTFVRNLNRKFAVFENKKKKTSKQLLNYYQPHYDLWGEAREKALELVPIMPRRDIIELLQDFYPKQQIPLL